MMWDHHYLFTGPDNVPVAVSVLRDVKLARPASGEEPADYGVIKTRLVVNDVDVDPDRYADLVQFVEEYGRRAF
jgi:hypothetical protein